MDRERSVPLRPGVPAEVNSLQVEEVVWRKIDWKTCLIDGFNTSRKLNNPVILWVFIDHSVDDKRC